MIPSSCKSVPRMTISTPISVDTICSEFSNVSRGKLIEICFFKASLAPDGFLAPSAVDLAPALGCSQRAKSVAKSRFCAAMPGR